MALIKVKSLSLNCFCLIENPGDKSFKNPLFLWLTAKRAVAICHIKRPDELLWFRYTETGFAGSCIVTAARRFTEMFTAKTS